MEIELKDDVHRLSPFNFWCEAKAMKHHVMGCLEDESPDAILLHNGTNDIRSEQLAEKIGSNIINVALSVKNIKNTVYVPGLTIRNDKYHRKRKEVNVILKKKCND